MVEKSLSANQILIRVTSAMTIALMIIALLIFATESQGGAVQAEQNLQSQN